MYGSANPCDDPIPNPELFLQGLEGAIFAPVPESTVIHVEPDASRRGLGIGGKGESGPGVNKAPDEPG